MYQSVGKYFRMHLRAASIHKISGGLGGPLAPHRFFLGSAGASNRYADISGWLEPWKGDGETLTGAGDALIGDGKALKGKEEMLMGNEKVLKDNEEALRSEEEALKSYRMR